MEILPGNRQRIGLHHFEVWRILHLKLGYIFVIVTCIFDSSVTSIWEENYSDMLVAFAGVNVYCSLDASEFYADNHSYIKVTKELINEYGNEQVSVYSTDMENYLGSLQSFGFLYRGNLMANSGFTEWFFSITDKYKSREG